MTDATAERREDYRARPWERHMQTVLTAVVLALLMWVGQTTSENNKQMAVMETRMGALNERLEEMRKALDGQDARYVSRYEHVTTTKILEDLRARVENLEARR